MGYECGFSSIDKRITNIYRLKKSTDEYDSFTLTDFMNTTEAEIANAVENGNGWEGINQLDLKRIYVKNAYGYCQITTDYDFWCSVGRYITDFIRTCIGLKKNDCYNIISKDDLINLLCELNKKYFDYENIKHYDIANGIIENDEDESQKLIPINGIELRNTETGEYTKILSCEDCTDFQYLDMSDDIDGVFASLIRCICDILENNDFDSYDIIFWESY